MKNWLVGFGLALVIVACGGNVSPRNLDGGWQLSHHDTNVNIKAEQVFFLNGRMNPRGPTIGTCNMPFQITGDILHVYPDTSGTCNLSAIRFGIEQVDNRQLVLSLDGRKLYFYRIASGPQGPQGPYSVPQY